MRLWPLNSAKMATSAAKGFNPPHTADPRHPAPGESGVTSVSSCDACAHTHQEQSQKLGLKKINKAPFAARCFLFTTLTLTLLNHTRHAHRVSKPFDLLSS